MDPSSSSTVVVEASFKSRFTLMFRNGEGPKDEFCIVRPRIAVSRVEYEPDEDEDAGCSLVSVFEVSFGEPEDALVIELQPEDAWRLAGMLMAHVTAEQLFMDRRRAEAKERAAATADADGDGREAAE
jgi:hypothetical protein